MTMMMTNHVGIVISSGYLPVHPRQAVDAPVMMSGNHWGTSIFGS